MCEGLRLAFVAYAIGAAAAVSCLIAMALGGVFNCARGSGEWLAVRCSGVPGAIVCPSGMGVYMYEGSRRTSPCIELAR